MKISWGDKSVDPWKDCERLYDMHFMDRMKERYLPKDQVKTALKEGKKIREQEDEYKVIWKKWTLKVSMGSCFLYLRTAYPER